MHFFYLSGLHSETLERLKKVAADVMAESQHPLVCSLIFDEIFTRKKVIWQNQTQRYFGYISYGIKKDDVLLPIANEAVVFMLSGINREFEFPVCYHLIKKLDTDDKTTLVIEVLKKITECGIVVKNVSFDGLKINFAMCRQLGANLDVYATNFKPYFENPVNKEKVYIIFDNCHAEKLVRNTLGNKEVIFDDKNARIKWKYFVDLERFSEENEFRTHKLSKKHIDFKSSCMNVKIASETMSTSVADSLQFLLDKGIKQFEGAAPTIRFTRIINDSFDIFNSRNSRSKQIFKNGMSARNKDVILKFFDSTINYLKQLKIEVILKNKKKRVLLCKSRNSTGFLGYIINMYCLQRMYTELVEEKKYIDTFYTYTLSQDHLEIFFSKMRCFHGQNNNPDVINFRSAYRKLCSNIKVIVPQKANCQKLQMELSSLSAYSDIYFISSRRPKLNENLCNEQNFMNAVATEKEKIYSDILALEEMDRTYYLTDRFVGASIAYVARRIEEKIEECFFCEDCKYIFVENEKVIDAYKSSTSVRLPCRSTYDICVQTDKFLRTHKWNDRSNFKVKYFLIFQELDFNQLYTDSAFENHAEHKFHLVKSIINEYTRTKGNQLSRKMTEEEMKFILRKKLNKMILRAGQ